MHRICTFCNTRLEDDSRCDECLNCSCVKCLSTHRCKGIDKETKMVQTLANAISALDIYYVLPFWKLCKESWLIGRMVIFNFEDFGEVESFIKNMDYYSLIYKAESVDIRTTKTKDIIGCDFWLRVKEANDQYDVGLRINHIRNWIETFSFYSDIDIRGEDLEQQYKKYLSYKANNISSTWWNTLIWRFTQLEQDYSRSSFLERCGILCSRLEISLPIELIEIFLEGRDVTFKNKLIVIDFTKKRMKSLKLSKN